MNPAQVGSLRVSCGDWVSAHEPSLTALQPHLVPHLVLTPPPHLLHHPACRAINLGLGSSPAPVAITGHHLRGHWSGSGSPLRLLLLLVAISGVIGQAVGPLLAPALAWCPPLTCSTILPWSCSVQGPLELAEPPLPPAASTISPTPAMFHTASW